LHDDILTDFDSNIGAIGFFVKDAKSSSGVLKVCHGFKRHPGAPGQSSVNRGKTFMYEGDALGIDIATYEFDEGQLAITDEVQTCKDPARHLQLLEDKPTADLVGPIEDTAANKEVYRTRKAMFIPYPLVQFVLGKDLTAREAFEILYPVMLDNNWVSHYTKLLIFLMIASTQPNTTDLTPATALDTLGIGATTAPEVLAHRRHQVLCRWLPSLAPQTINQPVDPQLTSIVGHMASLADNQRLEREDRERQRNEAALPKSVRDRYGDYITDMLLKMTGTGDDDDLPELYPSLAASKKGDNKRMVHQRAFDNAAKDLGFTPGVLQATTSHVLTLDSWNWYGHGKEQIGTGWLPLANMPPGAMSELGRKAAIADQERSHQHDMLRDGDSTLTTTEAKKLLNLKGYIPLDWVEAVAQVKCYVIALAAVLGHHHPNVAEHQSAYQLYETMSAQLHHDIDEKYGKKVGPALFVFYWQLHHRSWFFEQWGLNATSTTPAPKIREGLLTHLRNNRLDWLPEHNNIPALTTLGRVAIPPRTPGATPAAAAPAPRNNRSAEAEPRITRIRNANRDPRFIGASPLATSMRTRQVRDAIAAATLPIPRVTRNGVQMDRCLSHHLKGVCTEDCDRAADHVPLQAAEADELHQWCVPAYA